MGKLILKPPFVISSRLLPALEVGKEGSDFGTLSLKYDAISKTGRNAGNYRFRWHLDLKNGKKKHFTAADIYQQPCREHNGRTIYQQAFSALLSFLTAAAESYKHALSQNKLNDKDWMADSSASLFPMPVVEWAHANSDELELLALDLEQPELLVEED